MNLGHDLICLQPAKNKAVSGYCFIPNLIGFIYYLFAGSLGCPARKAQGLGAGVCGCPQCKGPLLPSRAGTPHTDGDSRNDGRAVSVLPYFL